MTEEEVHNTTVFVVESAQSGPVLSRIRYGFMAIHLLDMDPYQPQIQHGTDSVRGGQQTSRLGGMDPRGSEAAL